MKISDYIANELVGLDIHTVFGYQGGNISHVIDSIGNADGINFIVNYNEQGAAFAACAYALTTNGMGAALASSGPGAMNLISGIADAFYDSIPCIFITGNVNTRTMKNNIQIRQNAFQEADIVSMVTPITKYAVTVREPESIRYHWEKAVYLATEGRPGPVLLDLPHDIQRSIVDLECIEGFTPPDEILSDCDYTAIADMLQKAQRPLILVGGGSQGSNHLLQELVEKTSIPVVASLRGIDVLPHDHPCYCGFIGTYGNRFANLAMQYCDCLLVLGSRLDERQIYGNVIEVFKEKSIIHVDVDPIELGRIVKAKYAIRMHVDAFLRNLCLLDLSRSNTNSWLGALQLWKERFSSVPSDMKVMHANAVIRYMSLHAQQDTVFCADVGINQMCTAQSIFIKGKQKLVNSSGLGAMGFALPASIGAAFACAGVDVICLVGDGGLQMNLQELRTVVRERLPVHIVLLNNSCLGMIREVQKKLFNDRFYGTVSEFEGQDHERLAIAFGLSYVRIDHMSEMEKTIKYLRGPPPSLIEVFLPQEMTTIPDPGASMFSQLPLLSDMEFESLRKEVCI